MAEEDNGSRLIWFVAGAAIGAAVALLYAPQSGEDTRRFLGDKAKEGSDVLADSGQHLMDRGRELYERGRHMADEAAEMFERGRKIVDRAGENVAEELQG
jgi:gas vesicle protein